ncbi:DUF2188 domain-containing protein [Salimicrobium humidisoli]|uniref:DUF2188 domain-containing protein n=1 Tax=Salimicrobium humidisoli TaxID=2029857 RepID=A0ABX4HN64_9BACI|nr:DUF2188 domain-containing protein [Salimicrobium humidisoli]PBB04626.1 hypothetical protein CKW00_13155 [Salimicrobium humidisoli]
MPWDTQDYPDSLKNLDTAVRKKAITIANGMLHEGYEEGRAIPIATEQAKEWYSNASEEDINKVKQMTDKELRTRDEENPQNSRPELMEKGEHVIAHEDGWAVQAEDAKQPSEVFEKKEEAVSRAKEIAENKGTAAIIHKQDGSIQENISYNK